MKVEQHFEKRYRLIREIIETLVLTVLMFVIINLAVQNYTVDGPSMEPSLHNGERIMVDKVSYLFHPPARGDVIVFVAPPAPSEDYVKRIIALPGDTISIHTVPDATGSGHLIVKVNGVTINESSFVHPGYDGTPPGIMPDITRTIPAGQYFVMGDDRRNSSDSRDWGLLPRSNIIGRAALVYWPLGEDNSGFLPSVASAFSSIPQPGSHTGSGALRQSQPTGVTTLGASGVLLCVSPGLLLLSGAYRPRKKAKLTSQTRQDASSK